MSRYSPAAVPKPSRRSPLLFRPWTYAAVLLLALATAAATAQTPEAEPVPTAEDPAEPVHALFQQVETLRGEYRELASQRATAGGDELTILDIQLRKRLIEMLRLMNEMCEGVLELAPDGPETAALRERAQTVLRDVDRRLKPFFDSIEAELVGLRETRQKAPKESSKEIDAQIDRVEGTLDDAFRFYHQHVQHMSTFGLDAETANRRLDARLRSRAESIAGRLELARQRVLVAKKDAETSPNDANLQAALRVAVDQRAAVATSLRLTIDLMDDQGLPTAEYRQLLIEATGEITGDVLDVEVALGLFEDARDALARWFQLNGPMLLSRLGVFLLVLGLFWVLGGLTRRTVARVLRRSEANVSELSRRILVGTASRVVVGIGFFVALSQVGINVTALLTGLGIAGFIVGFALQDTLGNFASGAMILIYRPYDVGDVIEAGGVMGSVDTMNLVSTKILTFDNQTLVVPNSRIWGDVIRNVTEQKQRRVDLTFGLSHDTDLERAEALFDAVLRGHPHVLGEPAFAIRIHKLTDTAIEFIVRPWVETQNYWETYWGLNREIKLRLDEAGIQLAVPRREVDIQVCSESAPNQSPPQAPSGSSTL